MLPSQQEDIPRTYAGYPDGMFGYPTIILNMSRGITWTSQRYRHFRLTEYNPPLKKITMVVTTNSHCESVIRSGNVFYSWDYYNHIVKSTIIIFYYIFLVDIAIKNIFPLREI